LNGKIAKAQQIISEIDSEGKTANSYKEIVNLIIKWVCEGKTVKLEKIPFNLRRLVENSEEILYLINLFRALQPPPHLLS
jgi:hypothetical protein